MSRSSQAEVCGSTDTGQIIFKVGGKGPDVVRNVNCPFHS